MVELGSGRVRVGVDVVDVERMRRALERRPRLKERVFTPAERTDCEGRSDPAVHYAARFAAKEAVRKALGRAFPWQASAIRTEPGGRPGLWLDDDVASAARVGAGDVSLSHDGGVAVAVVVLEVADQQAPGCGSPGH